MASDRQIVYLKATYISPSTVQQPQVLSSMPLELPIKPSNVDSKTTYLRSLRAATVALQERINAELTARMEEDKNGRKQPGIVGKARGDVVDEAAEEENYGEVQEDEDL
ncbi:hypothetical protein GGS21DRAFT_370491 [Xylaria nigripes]|nr:hypothetical protein GGS21DRAFT_370491 [Xylaria nigripes]